MREAASETAYRLIRDAIAEGRYAEGDRLREEDLATTFATSRTPIREAIRRLAGDGFVVLEPRIGAVVRTWDPDGIRDLFNLRAVLEGFASRLAAEAAPTNDIDELEDQQKRMDELAAYGEPEFLKQFSEANTLFHRRIIYLSENRQLIQIAPPLVDLALITRTYRKFSNERIRKSCMDHADLVRAFRRRDGMWAEAIMRSHILSSVELATEE